MSKIFVTGDTHGKHDIRKLDIFAENCNLSKDDYMIILGDVSVYWDDGYNDAVVSKMLHEYPWTTLWIDGNHDNFDLIKKQKISEWNGGKVQYHKKYKDIIHLMRGQIYTICDKTFFTFGGALSIDKMYRTEHISWWQEEMPTIKEYNVGLDVLEKAGNKVNYIISHTAPESICKQLVDLIYPGEEEIQRYFEQISNDVLFDDWYFGHWHFDKDIDKYHARYNTISQII